MRGNPLNDASINTHIPALLDRGVAIDSDMLLGAPVNILDPNLRAAIENNLGKAPGTPITTVDMKRLRQLIAPNANITNLTGLEAATNLTWLILGIESLGPEGHLGSRNSISDLSPLVGLTNLTVLDLEGNSISDISHLARLTNLTFLNLQSNNISNISPVSGLTNLTYLSLGANSISDISPLVANTGLGEGDTVELRENPLSNASIQTHIPALESEGVTVEFDVPLEESVNILDDNLRAKIKEALGIASGVPITTVDMANLTRLDASNADITDLTGLEWATNLTYLDLGFVDAEGHRINSNSVSNLSPLVGLTQLIYLDLWGNSISDISPLAGLTKLTELELSNNSISDISSVAGLTNLRYLDLDGNSISDISGVSELTNLTRLEVGGSNLSDLSPLTNLTNLTILWLYGNNISDLSPLVANTGLGSGDTVYVTKNPLNRASIETHIPALQKRGVTVEFDNVITELVDIPDPNLRAAIENNLGKAPGAPITTADMANLTELVAQNSNISDLTGLEAATNLTRLDLGTEYVESEDRSINSNSVSDLSPLSGLTNLTWLRLRNNSISDISPLSGLTNLEWLNLGSNLMISDISVLSGLTNLTTLWLYGNSISDLSPLAGLTNLTFLNLWFNSISDISSLAGLTNLTWLAVDNNLISDISPLTGLTNLGYLGLSNHPAFIPATGLTHLTSINVNNNTISDLSPLVANTGLGAGALVEVWGNPLNDASIQTHIPALQDRGVTVEFIQTPTFLLKISGTVTESDNLLIVEVRDNRNRLLAGISVTFTVISGGGTLSATSATTGGNGRAESRLTLGPEMGTNRVSASVEGILESVTFSDVPEPPVDIPDSYLRAAIEARLNKAPGDPIIASDMARLTDLFALNANISNLTGLEAATNLTLLVLGSEFVEAERRSINSNSVSDLSPLAGLTDLEILDLDSNSISDISAVAGLTDLEFLNLANNSILDISAVAGLTNLTFLSLADNSIVDLSPLVENMGLGEEDWVDVQRNPLSFLSIYTHIPALQNRGVRVAFDLQPPVLSGHTDAVVSVAFSRDGTPASGGRDGTVILWDAVTEQPIATLMGHTASARSVAFSPDGSILASGSHDGTIILWDVATQQPEDTLTEHTAGVESIAFSRAGSTLASGSHDGTIILWDPVTGQPIDTIMGQANRIWSLAFSPDGTLAIGRDDGTILLWDVANGRPKDTLVGHTAFVESVAFNRDGSTLASGSGDNTVILWEVATGRPIAILPGHTAGVNSVAFSPDGTLLASGSDDSTVRLWDAVTGQPIITLTGHTGFVRSVAFSPDGTTLASGSGDSTVRLWEIAPPPLEFLLSIPKDLNLIHVPLKVTAVGGKAETIESVSDLYYALGGAPKVGFLVTYDSQNQTFSGYFGPSDEGTALDKRLNDDTGILANMIARTEVRLRGTPLGTNGTSTITLTPGFNVVGLPLRDSRITRVSDLLDLDGISGNVQGDYPHRWWGLPVGYTAGGSQQYSNRWGTSLYAVCSTGGYGHYLWTGVGQHRHNGCRSARRGGRSAFPTDKYPSNGYNIRFGVEGFNC